MQDGSAAPPGNSQDADERIAVFMPTWHCRPWLPRAIRSVLAQKCPHVDLYVVDDAGDDVDEELLEHFPQVSFLRMRERSGPYRIANLLLCLTESGFVAFQDADDWSSPERLPTQLAFLREQGFDGCGTWSLLVDLHGDPMGFEVNPENASLSMREQLNYALLHPTGLYRRRVFDLLGGFDDTVRFGADSEFLYRAAFSVELGNVQRFLYRRTIRPEALTQASNTGFHSAQRTAYLERITAAAEARKATLASPPPPDTLLNGSTLSPPSLDTVDWIRPGQGQTTLKRLHEQARERVLR
jgi:glycosyltransferase involved in cell wall biosynthesis